MLSTSIAALRLRWSSMSIHEREAAGGWLWVVTLLLIIVCVFVALWERRA